MVVNEFAANEILDISVSNAGRAGVSFLNWRIAPSPLTQRKETVTEFAGAGLYALCFDNELIYLGSYLGVKSSTGLNTGNVVGSRWWTHVGSITGRGHKVHVARQSVASLADEFGQDHPMVIGFTSASTPDLLHKDAGCLAPLRRLRFAADRWDEFGKDDGQPEAVLKRFTFIYARVNVPSDCMDSTATRTEIVNRERGLIEELAPPCNATYVRHDQKPVSVAAHRIREMLATAIQEIETASG